MKNISQQIRINRFGLLLIIVSTLLTSCQLGRFVIYNFADIKDHKKFQSRPLTAHNSPYNFETTNSGKFPKEKKMVFHLTNTLKIIKRWHF
jgi:hypothetical protein